jgi:hypothetical protein
MVTRRRIQAHSSNWGEAFYVTKVLPRTLGLRILAAFWLFVCAGPAGFAAESPPQKPAEALYLQLGQVGLDPARVYQVRGASLDRSAIHITLDDGTIAFTEDVMGRITGAFFEGEGEVLLAPPSDVERRSMSLFTGMAILEERFATAYFRFNDDAASEMSPDLRQTENKQAFVERWGSAARNLAGADAMRLLLTFSTMLPLPARDAPVEKTGSANNPADRFLHARLQGTKLGVFDVVYDSLAGEQIEVGQSRQAQDGASFFDVWTSFTAIAPGAKRGPARESVEHPRRKDSLHVRRYVIWTEVQPPKRIHSRAQLQAEVETSGSRIFMFELSRFLQIESVQLDGQPVEFIHNPAVEGTQLARRGNDTVAVILPEPAQAGQILHLEFVYEGEVLAQAGTGLLYVGERGTWYPNRGLGMADFDLRFDYPAGWTLVATGKPMPATVPAESGGLQHSHWVSDRPIPVAGFNLGKYRVAKAQAGSVTVETYATVGVEASFPSPPIQAVLPPAPQPSTPPHAPLMLIPSRRPSPAQNAETVEAAAARAIRNYSRWFGPYPYSELALTQMPGIESQGWPGLIFLSSYVFLNQQEREQLHLQPYQELIQESIPAHETAHQWWGDLITWNSYRDQWFSEGLANYCAMMLLQEKDPAGFRTIMEQYRHDLVEKNQDGFAPKDAGPVTLGVRLLSSRFPQGYEAVSYGRATWLFHMLRTMLLDGELEEHHGKLPPSVSEEPFIRALRRLRERDAGKSITTGELVDVFAEDLPPALRYEGRRSLDWFLQGWINGTALPTLQLKSVRVSSKGTSSLVSGTILQKDAPSDLVTSVPLYALVSGKSLVLLGRVFADGAESTFHIFAPAGTRKILLDPYGTILTNPK